MSSVFARPQDGAVRSVGWRAGRKTSELQKKVEVLFKSFHHNDFVGQIHLFVHFSATTVHSKALLRTT